MSEGSDEEEGSVVVDVVESVAAAIGCAVIAGAPLWLGLLADVLLGVGPQTFAVVSVVVVVVPAAKPMPSGPALNGYQRWGLRVGRVMREPLDWAASRRADRSRALGSASSSMSAAAPSLPPPKQR